MGDYGTILTTSDGGAHWRAQSVGIDEQLSAIAFPDASHGWAVGSGGAIIATTAGGVAARDLARHD